MEETETTGDRKERLEPLHVLVAEDDAVNQLMVRRVLERHGHLVTIVNNGEKAVEEAGRVRYDVILMDIQMPVMDGFNATMEIRKREHTNELRTPIIAFTALNFSEEFLRAGMDGYIGKPLDPELMLATLATAVSR